MGRGSYNGGSTVIKTNNYLKRVGKPSAHKKKGKKAVAAAPGLHVLTKDERREIMRKIHKSRREAEEKKRKDADDEMKRRRDALEGFKRAIRNRSL